MPKLRFLILATAVLAGGLLTPACGDDPTEPESIVGTYILQTLNGMNLPVAPTGGPQPPTPPGGGVLIFEFTAGSVRLNSDDTCSLSLTFRTTIDGTVTATGTDTDTCTYSVTGTTIRFDFPSEAPISRTFPAGIISGNTITVVDGGDTFVFRK